MADNVAITPGVGESVRTKDKGGVDSQVVIVDWGGAGAEDLTPPAFLTDAQLRATPVPVSGPATNAELRATALPVTLSAALPAGTNAIGKLAANDGVDIGNVDVTSLPALAAGSNTIGGVTRAAQTSGGCTPWKRISTADDNAAVVKASPGCLYYGYNTNINNGSPRYLKLYDKATTPTSSDTPVHTLLLPGNTAGAGGAPMFPIQIEFTAGIAIRITTGAADNDTGAPAAGEVIVNLGYK